MFDEVSEIKDFLTLNFDNSELYQNLKEKRIRDGNLPKISISSLGTACDLCLYNHLREKALDIQEQPEPNLYRTFDIGHSLEAMLIRYLEEIKKTSDVFFISDQQKLYENEFLRGYIDCNLKFKDKEYITDIKTMNDVSFGYIQTYKKLPERIKAQMHGYMYLSDTKKSLVLGINKNNSNLLVHVVEYDEEYADKLIKRAFNIHQSFLNNDLTNIKRDIKCKC